MDKPRKNLLGRTVAVKRKAMSDGSLEKTRVVRSKSGGVISSKTTYKDAGSVAGKMRANTIKKTAMEGAKMGVSKTSTATKPVRFRKVEKSIRKDLKLKRPF